MQRHTGDGRLSKPSCTTDIFLTCLNLSLISFDSKFEGKLNLMASHCNSHLELVIAVLWGIVGGKTHLSVKKILERHLLILVKVKVR